ncbi:hypothetical protein [Acinetobacter bereziniae]|uniref:hypothetical protein n=1 Tax=Acinetobacter bereziniae TaxID=106648 RepID=UPI0030183CC6
MMITNTTEFKIGTKVVFINDDMPNHIMTISRVDTEALWMDDDHKFAIKELVRVATAEEIESNCRGIPSL